MLIIFCQTKKASDLALLRYTKQLKALKEIKWLLKTAQQIKSTSTPPPKIKTNKTEDQMFQSL